MAKIATGNNPADNFWRQGNMLGAIEIETGLISRVIRGTGAEMSVNEAHPDTKRPIVGTLIPQWAALIRLVISAAEILPGIRTQSWDVALAAAGPVHLEVNYGGDLNLAQLAPGAGVLDERYVEHLACCGYRSRALREAMGEPSRKSRPDLDVPVLGHLTPPQLPLGGFLKACSLQVVCFNAAFGGGCLRQQTLEHAPRYPHHAAEFADFNAKCNSLPLGIPSGVIGKGEEHRRIR
ncbi:MAG: sugar-transfer associated ATP-grasp domain-containing protein [Stellaceae bacterium]